MTENLDLDIYNSSETEEDTLKDQFLSFSLGKEFYALEIVFVTEIIGIQKITEVPNVKDHIKGIINLRGMIIPVVDIRYRFGMKMVPYNDRTCIIVVTVNGSQIGLIVDEVQEVLTIASDKIFSAPHTYKGSKSKFINGVTKINETVVILLDIQKLLYDEKELVEEEAE
jgi:purine-binding chemotaxis protein CheW